MEFQGDMVSNDEIPVPAGLKLSDAILYAQTGWNRNLKDTFEKELNEYAITAREFISERYLGTCIGAYLLVINLYVT